ncbi:MAG: hypothetical protein COB08_004315 [Rhodobacteraceae bacterium]|nr:hypothetical protein [Paracoccaceae bacterium]
MKLFWFDDERGKIVLWLNRLEADDKVKLCFEERLDRSVQEVKNSEPFDLYIVDLLTPNGGRIPADLEASVESMGLGKNTEMGGLLLGHFILKRDPNSRVLVVSNTIKPADILKEIFPKRVRSVFKGDQRLGAREFFLNQIRQEW